MRKPSVVRTIQCVYMIASVITKRVSTLNAAIVLQIYKYAVVWLQMACSLEDLLHPMSGASSYEQKKRHPGRYHLLHPSNYRLMSILCSETSVTGRKKKFSQSIISMFKIRIIALEINGAFR